MGSVQFDFILTQMEKEQEEDDTNETKKKTRFVFLY
jgi:hypothetical protein